MTSLADIAQDKISSIDEVFCSFTTSHRVRRVLGDQMGVQLRSLSAPAGGGEAGEAGGGGVRDARVSSQAPPLLLLASDDGVTLVWSLATQDPKPLQ